MYAYVAPAVKLTDNIIHKSGFYPRLCTTFCRMRYAMLLLSKRNKENDLPCDLPCAASLAGIQPVRPRAQRTSP